MAEPEVEFLQAIETGHDTDDMREVYADWLEEQGRPERAEYLRLEAEVRSYDFVTGDPEREAKKARRDELATALEKSCRIWFGTVTRRPRTRVKLLPPTTGGLVAPPVPTRVAEPGRTTSRSFDPTIYPVRSLFAVTPLLDTSQPGKMSWGRSLLWGVLVAAGVILVIKEVSTEGWFDRLLHRIYEDGPRPL